MLPERCDSEYCVDVLRHWYPAMERVVDHHKSPATAAPVLFQFSDDEFSKAYSPTTARHEPYPNLPHLKKSRLSLLPQDITNDDRHQCAPVPKPILPTVVATEHVPEHLQPSTCVCSFCICLICFYFICLRAPRRSLLTPHVPRFLSKLQSHLQAQDKSSLRNDGPHPSAGHSVV